MKATHVGLVAIAAVFAGCTTLPSGPSTMALPGSTKGFDQFRYDDGGCRQYAYDSIGGQTAARAQEDAGVRSAATTRRIRSACMGKATGLRSADAYLRSRRRRMDRLLRMDRLRRLHRRATATGLRPRRPPAWQYLLPHRRPAITLRADRA